MISCRLLFFACALLVVFQPARAADNLRDRQVGYFLFNKTAGDESQVHMLTFIKTTPSDLADYLKRVADTAGRSLAFVQKVEDRHPDYKIDKDPLPQFELDVRASIREDKEHNLLFGTKNVRFQRAVLLAQLEATNYMTHMAKVLAQDDPDHARELMRLSNAWRQLRDEGVRLSAGR